MNISNIPNDFPYRAVFLHGRPRHENDDFSLQHPPMARQKRAKIFAPFDALDGYGDALRAKNTVYTEKPGLSGEQAAALDRKLTALRGMLEERVRGRRTEGRETPAGFPRVRITYYVPCSDPFSEAYGKLGIRECAEGFCTEVDSDVARAVRVDGTSVSIDDILRIVILAPPAE